MFFLMRAIFWIVVVTLFLPYPSGSTQGQAASRQTGQATSQAINRAGGPAASARQAAEAGQAAPRSAKPMAGHVAPSRGAPAPSALAQAARLCTDHRQACVATAQAARQLGGGLADGADLIGAYLEASGSEPAPAGRSLR